MPLVITSTDEIQKPVNVVMSETFLRRARQKLPYYMGTQPGSIARQAGTSTIKWRRIEQETPTTTPLAELTGNASFGMGRDADVPTFTDIVATVSKYGQFYIVNEEVDLFNPNGTMTQLSGVLGESAGRSMNMLQRDEAEDNLTPIYTNGASDAEVNTILSANAVKRAVQDLWVNSARTFTAMTTGSQNIGTAPILASYWAISHPHLGEDWAALPGWKSVETYAGQVQTAIGEFGYYSSAGMGVRVLYSEDAGVRPDAGAIGGSGVISTGGTNADLYDTVIYGQDCLGSVGLGQNLTTGIFEAGDDTGDWEIIIHDRGSAGTGDPFNEIATQAWKSWHASAVLNPAWGRRIVSAATDLEA